MKTITGTCYFPSTQHEINYYITQGEDAPLFVVQQKIVEGAIFIGNPPLKENERAFLRDNRWHIEEMSHEEIAGIANEEKRLVSTFCPACACHIQRGKCQHGVMAPNNGNGSVKLR